MSDRALRLAVAAVAAAGVAVAGYLTYVHYRPGALICTGGAGCEAVRDSSYAEIAGMAAAIRDDEDEDGSLGFASGFIHAMHEEAAKYHTVVEAEEEDFVDI